MGKSNLSCFRNIKNRAALGGLCRVTFKGLRHFVWLVVIEFKHRKAKQVSENHLIFLITLYIATNKKKRFVQKKLLCAKCLPKEGHFVRNPLHRSPIRGILDSQEWKVSERRGMQWKEMTRGLLIELHLEFVNRNYLFTLNVASNQMSMSSFSCMLGRISLKSFSAFLFQRDNSFKVFALFQFCKYFW